MRFALLVLLTACRPEVTGVDSAGGGAVDGPAVVVATVLQKMTWLIQVPMALRQR